MRLPQDRILHIDTEIVDGKVNVTAEWQGELVRCKDCRFWKNEHLCLVMSRYESIDTKAEHYCSWGERRAVNNPTAPGSTTNEESEETETREISTDKETDQGDVQRAGRKSIFTYGNGGSRRAGSGR